jgi:CheY-like chemotaxis protein
MHRLANSPFRDRLRIVWLEDEPFVTELGAVCLRKCTPEFDLLVFTDGDDAWRYLCIQQPDLFITDCCHPGLPGRAVIRKLAERSAPFPVIWSCGCSREFHEQDKDSFELKLTWLPKPWTFEQLKRALEDAINHCQNA